MSTSHHPLLSSALAVPALLALSTLAAAADATSGLRLSYATLPKEAETEMTIKNDLGKTIGSNTQTGDLESNWRVTASWIAVGATDPFGFGIGWGPYYGQVSAKNTLGTVTHRQIGLTVEPMVVWDPIPQLSVEASVSGSFAFAQGELLMQSTGGEVTTEKSKLGMAYDATLHLRPVWHPTKNIDLFAEVTYTPVMQERFNYKPSGLEVVEVDSYNGAGFGVGGGVRF